MLRSFRLAWFVLALLATQTLAQQPGNSRPGFDLDLATLSGELAKSIFKSADGNRNQWLSRTEFQHAVTLLDEAIRSWGPQGLLGRVKQHSAVAGDESSDPDQAIAELTTRLAKNARVNEPEFTLYVLNVTEQADRKWRQFHAAAAAQRKAYNAYRASSRSRRGPMVVPTPY
jgi:hypothetical protein